MKLSILASIFAIATIATSMQTASAQESRGARFNYAPNVWKSEAVRMPKGYGVEPVHQVQSGAVPSGNLLGFDPSMLKPATPPPPVSVISARPAMTSVTPAMSIPKTNANFNPMFGKPQVAQLPATPVAPVPQQAVAMPMQMKPIAANHAPVVARHSTRSVSAVLHTPHFVQPTSATPAVASYPTNFGYSPGPLLPSSSSGGGSASTKLTGRILGRHK